MLTTNLGEKIRELLLKAGGDMKKVELNIKKRVEKHVSNDMWGKYVTELSLQKEGWEADMITKSKDWASQRGLLRISEVHGREEWRLPLEESFSLGSKLSEIAEASGNMEVEDCSMHIVSNSLQDGGPSLLDFNVRPEMALSAFFGCNLRRGL